MARGTPRERLLAGLFPVATMVAAFFVILPVAMMVDGIRIGPRLVGKGLLPATFNWVLISGVPLMLGALPFLRNGAERAPAT